MVTAPMSRSPTSNRWSPGGAGPPCGRHQGRHRWVVVAARGARAPGWARGGITLPVIEYGGSSVVPRFRRPGPRRVIPRALLRGDVVRRPGRAGTDRAQVGIPRGIAGVPTDNTPARDLSDLRARSHHGRSGLRGLSGRRWTGCRATRLDKPPSLSVNGTRDYPPIGRMLIY